jgi:MFS family permease
MVGAAASCSCYPGFTDGRGVAQHWNEDFGAKPVPAESEIDRSGSHDKWVHVLAAIQMRTISLVTLQNPCRDQFRPPLADIGRLAAITACVILAGVMQALDTTIANVALPYMQGSVSASADQINWVLTSYIVAAAILTSPSGFLANRVGRKRVLMVAVDGFVIASMLRGMAQSLVRIVTLRLLQGVFGAAPVLISQSILLDIYALEERGSAMALFGVLVMVGPVLGPVIGGWLTDHFTWRWFFFINLPPGALAFAGISFFLRETEISRAAKLDWLGFGSLSIAIAAMHPEAMDSHTGLNTNKPKALPRSKIAAKPIRSSSRYGFRCWIASRIAVRA